MKIATVPKSLFFLLITLVGCALLTLVGCRPAPTTEKEFALLAQHKIHERCFDLKAGDRVDYRFEAGVPLAFNLHFHRGREIVYGSEEVLRRQVDDTFSPDTNGRYCLMWTNPHERTADISYAYTITRR